MNDDVIRIMCPRLTCRRILAVPPEARGRVVRCKGCGSNIRIPSKPLAPPVEAAPGDGGKPQAEAGEAA